MPYNKGDFTEQGVAGDVTALVRLNEKRVMKVVLSSDDESDNCDISGAVYDLLNEEVYPIGAGVSGNIEITENGENINVAPFATATVNVAGGGGGDFPKLTLNITNSSESEGDISVIGTAISSIAGMILASDMFAYYDVSFPIAIAKGETVTVTIYYSYDAYINVNTGALVELNNDATVTTTATSNTNMTFDNNLGGWCVTDSTIDSELNITCLVGR